MSFFDMLFQTGFDDEENNLAIEPSGVRLSDQNVFEMVRVKIIQDLDLELVHSVGTIRAPFKGV
jgi:hypothetical protein